MAMQVSKFSLFLPFDWKALFYFEPKDYFIVSFVFGVEGQIKFSFSLNSERLIKFEARFEIKICLLNHSKLDSSFDLKSKACFEQAVFN